MSLNLFAYADSDSSEDEEIVPTTETTYEYTLFITLVSQ